MCAVPAPGKWANMAVSTKKFQYLKKPSSDRLIVKLIARKSFRLHATSVEATRCARKKSVKIVIHRRTRKRQSHQP